MNILKKISSKTVMGAVSKTLMRVMIDNGTKDASGAPVLVPQKDKDGNEVLKATDLYTIIGKATGIKVGSSTYGSWVGFTGMFEAARCDTGEIAASSVCLLPEPMNTILVDRLMAGAKRPEAPPLGADGKPQKAVTAQGAEAVQFAFVIGIQPANNAFGYEYYTKALMEPKDDDLSELRALARGAIPQPAIAAPEAAPEPAPETPAEKPKAKK